jgi:adenylate cyclase
MAYPLPDKPSIAVLPFATYSGEQRDDFIAKGLTEDVITALSRLPQLFVISRTSSFAFKDKSATATEIAKELGVRYIVEGSIQRSGDTLRISAQLVDAVTGHHLWADNFDGQAKDLFALQDDIVRRILVELQVKLTGGDHARVASRGTRNLDAWLLRMQGMAELYKFTRESTVRARELFQKAHEADPQWNRPVGGLAWSYWWEARKGWTDDREAWIRKGIELAERAIEMDPNDTLGYMQLGNLYQLKGDHDRSIELREKAVQIAPNDFQANWGLGTVLYRAGQLERAVEVLKHAERQSPRHPASFTWALSQAQLLAGHYEDAIETAKRASARAPDRSLPHIQMTAAYSALGRMEEAHAETAEVLRIDPKFTVSEWTRMPDYKDRAAVDKLASLLIKAGLPE